MMSLPQRQIEYTIRRSTRARRSRLTVTDDGRAIVILPSRAPERDAADLVARHHRWVTRHVTNARQRRAQREARPALENGRELFFEGAPHRVIVTTSLVQARTTVVRENGALIVTRSAREPRSTAHLLEAFFRARARRALQERLDVRCAEMGIDYARFAVRDQRTRWGSASRRGSLSFSWRLMMCPVEVLDYVVVHELAHLRVAGHSSQFWRLVDRYFPATKAARSWLREHHDEIRHALD